MSLSSSAENTSALEKHLKRVESMGSGHSMRNVDFIYMINLDERAEKFASATRDLHAFGIRPYRFSAVDGKTLSLDAINNDIGLKFRPGMRSGDAACTFRSDHKIEVVRETVEEIGKTYFSFIGRGAIACALSHLSILQDALERGYETIWVMEDDVQVMRDPCIISDLIDDLDKLVGKENWDVLYTYRGQGGPSGLHLPADWKPSRPDFHCQNLLNLHQPVSEKFIRTGSRWGTHSMIIRHSGMVKILEFLKTHKLFYPYDVEIWLPPGIQLFAVIDDVVSTIAGAISDTGVEIRNTVRARTAAKVGTSRTTLTPVENDLFLLTARTELSQIEKQRLAQLLEKQPLHWGYLIQLAQVNGTYPLLHRHLCDAKNLDPPHALSELKQTVRTTAQQNFLLAVELLKLKTLLDSQSMEFICCKGPVLAMQAFGDLSARVFANLEIIVDPAQVADVQRTMLASGYTQEAPAEPELSSGSVHCSLFRKLRSKQTFARRENVFAAAFIDIYWGAAPPHLVSFEVENLIKDAIEVDVLGKSFRSVKPELLLVILCSDEVKHQWSLLRWIVDVAEIVNRHPQLNWEETYDIARAFAVTVKLDCALSLCAEFLGSQEKLPGFVLDRLGGEKFARMKERIVQAWFEPFSPRI